MDDDNMDLAQAEARFKRAQEALETFVQEHVILTLDGSQFASGSNADDLSRRLAALRSEYDRTGQQWFAALEEAKTVTR